MAPGFIVSTMDRPRAPVCPQSWPCSCSYTDEGTESSSNSHPNSYPESQSSLYCAGPTQNTSPADHQTPASHTGGNLHSQHALAFSLAYMMLLVLMKDLDTAAPWV